MPASGLRAWRWSTTNRTPSVVAHKDVNVIAWGAWASGPFQQRFARAGGPCSPVRNVRLFLNHYTSWRTMRRNCGRRQSERDCRSASPARGGVGAQRRRGRRPEPAIPAAGAPRVRNRNVFWCPRSSWCAALCRRRRRVTSNGQSSASRAERIASRTARATWGWQEAVSFQVSALSFQLSAFSRRRTAVCRVWPA
jgi:hypothetical protein